MFEIVFLFANFLWHQNAKCPIFAYYITHERVAAAVKRHKPKKKEKERDQRKAFSSFRFLFSAFDFRTICLHTICLQDQSVSESSRIFDSLLRSASLLNSFPIFMSILRTLKVSLNIIESHWKMSLALYSRNFQIVKLGHDFDEIWSFHRHWDFTILREIQFWWSQTVQKCHFWQL